MNQCIGRAETQRLNCVDEKTLNAWQYCKSLPEYHVGVGDLTEDQRVNGIDVPYEQGGGHIKGCGQPPHIKDAAAWQTYNDCLGRIADQRSAINARECASQMISGQDPTRVDRTDGAWPSTSIFAQCSAEKDQVLRNCRDRYNGDVAACEARYGS